ncbi:hypothetical protein [Cohnella thailandensis]|uniref:hypothetical protein n=1 Tax=Cohnella thailandensis TaxID=557557 RepID=UPI001AE12E09|nr:hypothetical protein [Cohnella thailandensis]MBP1976010.1 hypothetical protein [Cohnella thailandensis]
MAEEGNQTTYLSAGDWRMREEGSLNAHISMEERRLAEEGNQTTYMSTAGLANERRR